MSIDQLVPVNVKTSLMTFSLLFNRQSHDVKFIDINAKSLLKLYRGYTVDGILIKAMEQGTTFWLTTATTDGDPDQVNLPDTDDQESKDGDLSIFNQPAMMNFANIFAGASAAVASSGSPILAGQRVPPLSQIGITPVKRTALLPINNLHTMPTITQLTPLPQAQIISTSTAVVNSLNGMTPLTTTIYTLPLPSEPIQVPRNFIQQAAAASGLTASSGGLTAAQVNGENMLVSPQSVQHRGVGTETPIPTTPQLSETAIPISNSQAQVTMQQPTVGATFQCTQCNKTFENAGQLVYHTFVAHSELQERPHKCTACPESFLMDHHLRDHMRATHLPPEQGGGPPFTCSECMASFNDGGHLNYHLYTAHTIQGSKPAQPSFPCPECGKNFIKPTLLNAHMRNVHSGQVYAIVTSDQVQQANPVPAKRHKCAECGKAFKTLSYVKQHVMSVHDKPLKCTVCQRGFGRKSDLKRHMRGVHMKKRPHMCMKCGWTFSEVSNLKHHLQAVHQKEKNFRCMYCDKTFSLSSYLRTHLIRMHNVNYDSLKTPEVVQNASDTTNTGNSTTIQLNIPQPQDQQQQPSQHQQTVINMTTSNSQTNNIAIQGLQINAQAHNVRCYECGQTFANAEMLQNHVMSSHSQPFWCTVCGEGFALASQLQIHLQMKHTADEPQSNQHQITVQAVNMQNNGGIELEIREIRESQPTQQQSQQVLTPQSTVNVMTSPQIAMTSPQQNVVTVPQQQAGTTTLNILANKCQICGMIYNTSQSKHVCWKKFSTADSINDIVMPGDRQHVCSECGKGFKTTTHLKQHIRCVHSKEKPHKCSQCEKGFARISDLNRHIKCVHQKLKQIRNAMFVTLKCSECGAIYAETSQLKRHIYTNHLRGKPCFKCADCQEGFTDEAAFQGHICHEDEKPHVCTFCAKRFQFGPQLRRHVRSAHGRNIEESMIHKCFQCERDFGRQIDLERHIQAVHLKAKPHKCNICDKSFGLQGNLNKHVRAVHLLEKPHQCIECGKRFAHVGVLKRHLRDIHFYDKKASVKRKLAQKQITNAKALMRNIKNLQANAMLTQNQNIVQTQQQQTQTQEMKRTSQLLQPITIHLQQQPIQQINEAADLPTIENIATMAVRQQQQTSDTQTQQLLQQISQAQPQSVPQNTQQVVTV